MVALNINAVFTIILVEALPLIHPSLQFCSVRHHTTSHQSSHPIISGSLVVTATILAGES